MGCRRVYVVRVGSTGKVDHFKVRLVANGYTQIYDLDYCDTFSLVAKINTIYAFLAIVVIHH